MLHFLHKLEQLVLRVPDSLTVQASPGSYVIPPDDLKYPGVVTILPITVTFTYQNFVLVKGIYPGTTAMAKDSTTSTHDEEECWEEDLHSLSCSEDEESRIEVSWYALDTFSYKAHCCFSM